MSRTKQTIVLISSITSFIIAVVLIIVTQVNHITSQPDSADRVTFPEIINSDSLLTQIDIIAINPLRHEIILRMEFYPSDSLLNEDNLLAKDLLLDIKVVEGEVEKIYENNKRIPPRLVTLNLLGQLHHYPFESYTAFLTMELIDVETNQPFPLTVDLFTDAPSGYVVDVATYTDHTSSVSEDDDLDVDTTGFIDVVISLDYAPSVFRFIIFLIALQWVLAFIAFIVTTTLLVQGQKVTIQNFGWLGALLFAQISLRKAMPYSPPIGSFIDTISFFWVVGVITISLLILVSTWVIQENSVQDKKSVE